MSIAAKQWVTDIKDEAKGKRRLDDLGGTRSKHLDKRYYYLSQLREVSALMDTLFISTTIKDYYPNGNWSWRGYSIDYETTDLAKAAKMAVLEDLKKYKLMLETEQ